MNLKIFLPKWHLSAFCELRAQAGRWRRPVRAALSHFCYSRSVLAPPHGTDGQSSEILLAAMYFYVMRFRYLTEAGADGGAAAEASFVHRT